jgi:aspartyl-tRNA(Asn)/glutamyl-tRNA(Gln) amidotransferase subunit A
MTPERARAEADAAADRARRGLRRGPLDGVALAWKDNVDTAGTATEAGSRLLAGRVPATDAPVLRRATAAGLLCLGKTHMSELAFSGLGLNPMTATPPNALEPARVPGGSSSGTAVAVALHLAAAGIGTDTGGSVRIPAAWNGLVGVKTTAGRIPIHGIVALAATLDTVGPLTRTVEDAALLHAVLTGMPIVTEEAPDIPLMVAETCVLDGCDAPVIAGFEAAVARLARDGVAITRGPVPEFDAATEVATRLGPLVTREAWALWGSRIEASPGAMYPMIEARFRAGASITAEADAAARAAFLDLRDRITDRIARHGLLVMPTVACLPPFADRLLTDDAHYTERNLLALRNTRFANLLGLSAITLPLPEPMTGLMLVGGPGDEARLLAAGRALEPRLAA